MPISVKLLGISLVSVIGLSIALATAEWYGNSSFPTALGLIAGYIFFFLVFCNVFAAFFWGLGLAIFGRLGRLHFQMILIVTIIFAQLIAAVLCTYTLYQAGIYENFSLKQLNIIYIFAHAGPYAATIISILLCLESNLVTRNSGNDAIFDSINQEIKRESIIRENAIYPPTLICVLALGFLGWFFSPLKDPVFSAIGGAVFGIPLGMLVFRYLPGQKKLRDLEKIKRRLEN